MRAMAATADERARKRLGELVTQRRLHLRLSVVAAAERGGTTNKTWAKAESGQPVRDVTYANIERVLSWRPGSCVVILDGGDPVLIEQEDRTPAPQRVYADETAEDWLPAVAQDLRDAVREATMTTAPGLTGAEVQELERRVEDGLRRRLAERHKRAS